MNSSLTISDSDLRDTIKIKKRTTTGQYVCDCPFCGKEEHLYIDIRTQLFHCKRCDESGNVYKLLKVFDRTFLLRGGKTVEQKEKILSIREIIDKDGEIESETRNSLSAVRMPVGWKVLQNDDEYLVSRGINVAVSKRYHMGRTKIVDKYKDYIIIPIYDNGIIVGWVGRYAAKNVPASSLRYCNSKGAKFSEMLYGYDDIICGDTEIVILVEGIFDKIAVDRVLELDSQKLTKCVCTFGKKISNTQIKKLTEKNIRSVILLYDIDAVNEIRKYGEILQQYFDTTVAFTTKKDIDECNRKEAMDVFENMMSVSQFRTSVIKKLNRKVIMKWKEM